MAFTKSSDGLYDGNLDECGESEGKRAAAKDRWEADSAKGFEGDDAKREKFLKLMGGRKEKGEEKAEEKGEESEETKNAGEKRALEPQASAEEKISDEEGPESKRQKVDTAEPDAP